MFKLCAILLIWELFFGPAHTVTVTPAKVGTALFDVPADHTRPPPRS